MVLAHTSTGLREIKPSPCNVFAAANPHAKTPAEIQTRCLNPGPDTAASTPSLCAAAATPPWGSFSAGMEGGRVPRGHSAPSTAPQHRAAGTQQHQAPPRRLLWLWQSPSPISWGHLRGCSLPGCRGGSLLGRLGEKQGFWGLCRWEGAGRQLKDPSAPAQSSGAGLRQDVPPPQLPPPLLAWHQHQRQHQPEPGRTLTPIPPHTPRAPSLCPPPAPTLHPGVLQPPLTPNPSTFGATEPQVQPPAPGEAKRAPTSGLSSSPGRVPAGASPAASIPGRSSAGARQAVQRGLPSPRSHARRKPQPLSPRGHLSERKRRAGLLRGERGHAGAPQPRGVLRVQVGWERGATSKPGSC